MPDNAFHPLTAEERNLAFQRRKELGNPYHCPPHPYRERGYYLLTVSTYKHQPILNSLERLSSFEALLFQELKSNSVEGVGWVIMPTHYHLLVNVERLEDVSKALKRVNGKTSREWNLEDGQTGNRKVWYKFYDRYIRTEHHFYQAFNYIHFNLVKHGFATDPFDWVWTSLHEFYESNGREWLRSTWKAYPVGDMGKGWDDDEE